MPKKLTLDLKGLRVKSFVTSLGAKEKADAKGGATNDTICYPFCSDECTDTQVGCSNQTCISCNCTPGCGTNTCTDIYPCITMFTCNTCTCASLPECTTDTTTTGG
jgi:hypothetical protein